MKKTEHFCAGCGTETTHIAAGFFPKIFTRGENGSEWERVGFCTECGGLTQLPVTDQDIDRAHERYVDLIVEQGVMTEEQVKEKLEA